MSNDCQACGSVQADVKRSISLESLHEDKQWTLQMGMRYYPFAGYRGNQIKVAGQKGTAKMSGCNQLWLGSAVYATGLMSMDAGEQSAEATPSLRGTLLPPHAGGKLERGTL
jgi:hypothetical protein